MKTCLLILTIFPLSFSVFFYVFHTSRIHAYVMHEEIIRRVTVMDKMDRPNQTLVVKKREMNNETKTPLPECKRCTEDVPNTIIQFGPPRTATTLQFQILCLMMTMLHENEASSVGCSYHTKPSKKYNVIKTHVMGFLLQSLPQNVWVFMTTRDKDSSGFKSSLRILESSGRKVRYIVDTNTASARGYSIANEFQAIFKISSTHMSNVMTYLRFWEILRRCCGQQMSRDWRSQLLGLTNKTQNQYNTDIKYPACEMYNIAEVEKLFINTYIYKRFARIESLYNTIGKPSNVDGNLDGNYCIRCNENVAKRRLNKINLKCA